MPKIIFEKHEKNLIPDGLKDSVKELEDGTFELDASGILKKNKELLGKNASLQTKVEEAEAAQETAEATAAEWKGKAKIPSGHKIVADEIAELGEAAQEAGIVKDEMPGLKTKATELQKKIDGFENEKMVTEVADSLGFNKRFILAAKDKGLKFEKTTEKDSAGKDVDFWNVVEGDKKTKVEDFLKTDAYFKEFAETFKGSSGENHILGQESGKEGQQIDLSEKEMQAQASTGRYSL